MVNRIYPADAIGGAPAYSGRALRQTQAPFAAGATAARPLGARSGVRPGTPASTISVTTTTWTCQPHGGILDVQTAAEAAPYTYAIDAAVSGALTAANASNPRTDIIYVQLTDNAEDGTGQVAATVAPKYLAGTAQSDAPAPATPARSIRLGRINVPRSGTGSPTVTWDAPYAVAAGAPLPFPTKLAMDQQAGYEGARAVVYADSAAGQNGDYAWSGSKWVVASRQAYRFGAPPALSGGAAQPTPPADAVVVRRFDSFGPIRTDANGLAQIGFEAFSGGILNVIGVTLSGSAQNPVINSGQITKSSVVFVWPDNKGGIVYGMVESVGWL